MSCVCLERNLHNSQGRSKRTEQVQAEKPVKRERETKEELLIPNTHDEPFQSFCRVAPKRVRLPDHGNQGLTTPLPAVENLRSPNPSSPMPTSSRNSLGL
jgi:hypothetical protein